MFWLNTCVGQRVLQAPSAVMDTVDPLCVDEAVYDKFVPRENRVLATLLPHMWHLTKKRLPPRIRWARSHTGDGRNIIADRLVDCGKHPALQHPWWWRGFVEWRIGRGVSIQMETSSCDEDVRVMCPGLVDFARFDPVSMHIVPALATVTVAVAEVAIKWSGGKRGNTGLLGHDPTILERRKCCLERRREKDPEASKSLSITMYRARQVMRRKQADLRFKIASSRSQQNWEHHRV